MLWRVIWQCCTMCKPFQHFIFNMLYNMFYEMFERFAPRFRENRKETFMKNDNELVYLFLKPTFNLLFLKKNCSCMILHDSSLQNYLVPAWADLKSQTNSSSFRNSPTPVMVKKMKLKSFWFLSDFLWTF